MPAARGLGSGAALWMMLAALAVAMSFVGSYAIRQRAAKGNLKSDDFGNSESVRFLRGGRAVVRNANLKVDGGCLCALFGPNGSGKSTVIKALPRAAVGRADQRPGLWQPAGAVGAIAPSEAEQNHYCRLPRPQPYHLVLRLCGRHERGGNVRKKIGFPAGAERHSQSVPGEWAVAGQNASQCILPGFANCGGRKWEGFLSHFLRAKFTESPDAGIIIPF